MLTQDESLSYASAVCVYLKTFFLKRHNLTVFLSFFFLIQDLGAKTKVKPWVNFETLKGKRVFLRDLNNLHKHLIRSNVSLSDVCNYLVKLCT